MIQITSNYFCAGAILDKNYIVINAAPIIRYMVGWHGSRVRGYCRKKNWKLVYKPIK